MVNRLVTVLFALVAGAASAARVEVFPQSFQAGGWGLDAGLMDVIGSPHLIAHGMGRPVPDATAKVVFPEGGAWRVFVRAKNWADGAPGKFSLLVDGVALKHVFGAGERAWAWEDGGTVEVKAGTTEIALRDLTGFDGRCAGVVFTKGGEPAPTGALDVRGRAPEATREFDFVVIGGGLPGCCAAVAAARAGVRVALVQDRPVLGGNASSEIRVWSGGESRHPLVDELRGLFMNSDPLLAESDRTRFATLQRERNLSVFLLHRAFGVEKDGDAIASVKALDLAANRVVRFRAPLFCDATGDGWVGFWAGADLRYGREAASEFGEKLAPKAADRKTLGASLMWASAVANDDVPFAAPWAERFAESGPAVNGDWNWEYGLDRDMIGEAEEIRDRLLLAIYGAFSLAKRDPANARRMIVTCPYVLGKRESRRILGDWILKEQDVAAKTPFEDAVATGSWSIDLHETADPKVPYLTRCRQPHYGRYWIPYRCLYSRNVPNLFLAGRCFSCTHVGLGSPRVINTLSQLGVAVGHAAAMCREAKCRPRQIFADGRCRELQRRIGGDWPGNPDAARKGWLYVDDETPGVEVGGAWTERFCCNGGQVGDKAKWSRGAKSGPVVYPLPVKKSGRYRLYGNVPYEWGFQNCRLVAELRVTSGGQETALSWNQAVNTGRWNAIGEVTLEPGARLTLLPGAFEEKRKAVIADGYALEPLD